MLISSVVAAALCWWAAIDGERYQRMWNRARALPLTRFIIAVLSVLCVVDFFTDCVQTVLIPFSPILVVAAFLAPLFLSLRYSHQVLGRTAMVGVASFIALVIAELIFRCFLLQHMVPVTTRDFNTLISSHWSHPVSVAKPEGAFRILGLADSFGTAGGDANYHYILEQLLRQDDPHVEIINISHPAYDPIDELTVFRRFGRHYKPDIVLHSFFVGNDFTARSGDLMSYRGIPVRPCGGLTALRPNRFMLSQLLRSYRILLNDLRQKKKEQSLHEPVGSFSSSEFLRLERDRLVIWRTGSAPMTQWDEVSAILDTMRKEVSRNGGTYVMVIHPDQFQVENALREKIFSDYHLTPAHYDIERPQKLLTRYCASRGIPCIDLLPIMCASGSNGGLYLLRDTHYNEEGNRIAARAIYEFLRAKKIP
ncbi:MAG: hypothetical protein NTZ78_14675 [Candidatus Aureabacteria bacterium]|nr:hypothetical protein [Candidatus Auribacterota bacterium]